MVSNEVLSIPNILMEKKGEFKKKPAIIVAAGRSLNEEIENIRHVIDNGLSYIFSVGSAINTLIYLLDPWFKTIFFLILS